MRRRARLCSLGLALVAPLAAAWAATDLHRLWDDQCGECHGHAAEFARDALRLEDGRLAGARHRDLDAFLQRHNGGLARPERERVLAMLTAQVTVPGLFRAKCADCHGSAAELARRQLLARDGALVGRYSGRSVADFLLRHGELAPPQRAQMLEVLSRVEREVHGR